MLLTNDDAIAERARSMRNLCFRAEPTLLAHRGSGYNFRLTNLQAAIGVAQVERIDEIVARKRAMAAGVPRGPGRPAAAAARRARVGDATSTGCTVSCSTSRPEWTPASCRQLSHERGVQTRPFFIGMHEQPVFHDRGLFAGERYPVAERLARQGLYLPSGSALTREQQAETIAAVREVLS